MDAASVNLLREMLASTGWIERTRQLGLALRSTRSPGGLLVVGTPEDEPWHLAAHLDEESRFVPQLAPTLVRWSPPPGAPPHLRVGLDRLRHTGRGETLFVVTQAQATVPLLERVDDARRAGATILALDEGDPELDGLAHEVLNVPALRSPLSFDAAQHLVSTAAGADAPPLRPPSPAPDGHVRGGRGFKERLSRFLDVVSGPKVLE
ncbi:hypothetical protein [Rhizohabitans arisaemae]|uniref:hypothetical protein n=1 Tax=Rhizohabitans arisaemae TaxID=2720610 RepID=UPI0024B0C880|nr:hypothetical protein [Rhizohabitans arisaemae]